MSAFPVGADAITPAMPKGYKPANPNDGNWKADNLFTKLKKWGKSKENDKVRKATRMRFLAVMHRALHDSAKSKRSH